MDESSFFASSRWQLEWDITDVSSSNISAHQKQVSSCEKKQQKMNKEKGEQTDIGQVSVYTDLCEQNKLAA